MNIRPAKAEDLPEILAVYAYAREFMKKTGNPRQWGDSWPPAEVLSEDIRKGQLYVVCGENGICGSFAFILGEDPSYREIDGSWLNDAPYGAIHRVASNGTEKGVMKAVMNYCESRIDNLRIDTHGDNKVMQGLIRRAGFTLCGTIHVIEDDDPRVAFQKDSRKR